MRFVIAYRISYHFLIVCKTQVQTRHNWRQKSNDLLIAICHSCTVSRTSFTLTIYAILNELNSVEWRRKRTKLCLHHFWHNLNVGKKSFYFARIIDFFFFTSFDQNEHFGDDLMFLVSFVGRTFFCFIYFKFVFFELRQTTFIIGEIIFAVEQRFFFHRMINEIIMRFYFRFNKFQMTWSIILNG